MFRTFRVGVLVIFVAAVGLAVMPAAANIAGSTLAAVDPGHVDPGTTFDITFTVNTVSPDLDWVDRFDVTLPSSWTINAIYPNPGGSCGSDGVASISGQTLIWQDPTLDDGCGPWYAPGTHTFSANVTVNSCDGAPWNLPWNISSDTWGAPPHDVSGTYSAIGCGEIVVPGCDVTINIPASAVGATFLTDAPIYWKPGEITEHVFPAGTTVRAIGLDESGAYYQVLYVCDFLWVPAESLGPNYNAPWYGAPLPTMVVD